MGDTLISRVWTISGDTPTTESFNCPQANRGAHRLLFTSSYLNGGTPTSECISIRDPDWGHSHQWGCAEMIMSKNLILFINLRRNTWNLIDMIGVILQKLLPCLQQRCGLTQPPCTGDYVLWLGRRQSAWCPMSEAALGVSMYSLRKPQQTSSFKYHRRLLQWVILCPLLSCQNNDLLLWEVQSHIGSNLGTLPWLVLDEVFLDALKTSLMGSFSGVK